MAQIIKQITVDVAKKNLFQAIVAKQNDSNSRFLQVAFVNEGEPIVVEQSSSVIINAERADNASKSFAGSVNDDGTVTVPLTNWMLELDDFVRCDVSIIDSESRKLTSTSFTIEVEAAVNSGEDISDDENYDILITLLGDVADTKRECEAATASASAAAEFATNSSNLADEATVKATDATTAAVQATQNANTATENANAATDAAKVATQNADIATESATAAAEAARAAASEANTANAISAHNASGEAHSDIRDKIALLQKYPCYEYSTSGGAVQRFDEVSLIPHNIGVTVHGATDENGNSVTNPTVSVYGKNMHVFNYKNSRGYTFSGSNCKIVNPTQYVENPYNPSLLLPAGTYTFSCRVTGSREYANKRNFSAFFYIGETQTNIEMNDFVSGTRTFKKTFTVTEPTAFRFNNVWFIETPTSADMSLDFQLEVGSTVTEYEPYIEPQTVTVPMTFADGEVCEIGVLNAVSPTMTVIATDDNAVVSVVDVTYNRDVKKALDKLEAAIAALV